MDILSNLKYAPGSKKKKKRIGRGEGSGHGGTATRGMNGQLSRSGAKKKSWFEGGQMPLQRRIPKFGFTNIFKKEYQVVNIEDLQNISEKITEEVLNIEA
jgi:large subunit ribosomal protein L15